MNYRFCVVFLDISWFLRKTFALTVYIWFQFIWLYFRITVFFIWIMMFFNHRLCRHWLGQLLSLDWWRSDLFYFWIQSIILRFIGICEARHYGHVIYRVIIGLVGWNVSGDKGLIPHIIKYLLNLFSKYILKSSFGLFTQKKKYWNLLNNIELPW